MAAIATPKISSLPDIAGVWRGRELTRKHQGLSAALESIDSILGEGIPRGRISELTGPRSSGKTSLAAAFMRSANCRGEVVAVIDRANSFDPAAMAAAGVDLRRVLWVHPGADQGRSDRDLEFQTKGMAATPLEPASLLSLYAQNQPQTGSLNDWRGTSRKLRESKNFWRAAELIMEAGGFGLLVLDCGEDAIAIGQSTALRMARMAEHSGTAVLIVASRPLCGTFAALNLALSRTRILYDNSYLQSLPVQSGHRRDLRLAAQVQGQRPANYSSTGRAPLLFNGFDIRAMIRRNKLGYSGATASCRFAIDSGQLLSCEAAGAPADQGGAPLSIHRV